MWNANMNDKNTFKDTHWWHLNNLWLNFIAHDISGIKTALDFVYNMKRQHPKAQIQMFQVQIHHVNPHLKISAHPTSMNWLFTVIKIHIIQYEQSKDI